MGRKETEKKKIWIPIHHRHNRGDLVRLLRVLMDQVKQQLAQSYAEEFFGTLREKCFAKCVTKPGTSLSGSESSCISRCVERYIEATGIISRSVLSSMPR
ncbi:hypothetical protein O6H91_Y075200 [Diphasiastrum complanatum]|nr:hypothetical protein O6H91_Y075200 [Diphasiastrum complanatum]